jgi:hypothetical protein
MRNPHRPTIDVAGVLTVTGGLFALVFGFANAETHSWSAPLAIISIASSAVLLLAFVGIEIRTAEPLLPLDIIRDRARGGAYAAMALAGASVFSLFLFLTFFLQNDLRFTPLLTGVSFLPFTASVILAAMINQTRVLPRLGARPVVFGGSVLGGDVAADATLAPGEVFRRRPPGPDPGRPRARQRLLLGPVYRDARS